MSDIHPPIVPRQQEPQPQQQPRRRRPIRGRRRRKPADGALEVCLAIASVTTLVTVDASEEPFAVDPPDLFQRRFCDDRVGLSDRQMPIFKANLGALLPQVAVDIARIADNAQIQIGDLSDFVADALADSGAGVER
jgi:hypothetical protein